MKFQEALRSPENRKRKMPLKRPSIDEEDDDADMSNILDYLTE